MTPMSFETILRVQKWPTKDLNTVKTRKKQEHNNNNDINNNDITTTTTTTTTEEGNKTAEAREFEI